MAIDVERIIMDSLLALVEDEGVPLSRVTGKQLLERSGVSRQTFYNHFLDKNDLIAKVYDRMVISEFDERGDAAEVDFRSSLVASLGRMRAHAAFLSQALRMTDQNNLTEHAIAHSRAFDLAWHQRLWGPDPMPDELRFATEYHAMASSYMVISWVLSGFPVSEEELAGLIADMRGSGTERLFEGAETPGNPYA